MSALRSACRGLIFADQLVRTTYFGMTTLLLLLGAATAGVEISGIALALLVGVAACFHVHVYVMNDVIDLEVDATAPRRAEHPLVRGLRGAGGISRRGALALAWLAAALTVPLCLALAAPLRAWLALAAGFALIGIYNLYGKRCPLPPVTDAAQGLGWWGLVLFGLFAVAPDAPLALIADRTLPLLAYALGFTLLISGVHGGLRDLVNDAAHGRTNTPRFLGARPAPEAGPRGTEVTSSLAVVAYSFVVLAAMFAPSFAFLREPAHFGGAAAQRSAAVAMALCFAVNCALLWRVVKPCEPWRDPWISRQAVTLSAPPLLLYLLSALPSTRLGWLVALLYVVPLLVQDRFVLRLLASLEGQPAPEASRYSEAG